MLRPLHVDRLTAARHTTLAVQCLDDQQKKIAKRKTDRCFHVAT